MLRPSSYGARIFCLTLTLTALSGAAAQPTEPVRYEVRFEGIQDRALLDATRALSQAVALENRPPATRALLKRRAQGDVERFEALLASEGYFAGTASFAMDEDRSPLLLMYRLERGPSYRRGELKVDVTGMTTPAYLDPQLPDDQALTTRMVLHGEQRLVRQLNNHGHPFAKPGERTVVVDHGRRRVDVTYRLEPGPHARLGEVQVEGLKRVRERAVFKRRPWEDGAPFDARLIDKFRKELVDTGMFLTVKVEGAEELDAEGVLPVTVEVRERKRRTIRLGLEFVSDIGFGVSLDWDYRNFLRREVLLQTSAKASEIELAFDVQLTRDRFLHPNQRIVITGRVAEDSPDAYVSVSGETAVLLSRRVTKELRITGGVGLKLSEVEQGPLLDNYTLLLSPWNVDYNFSDDLLDPGKGGRAIMEFTPFTDLHSGNLTFTRTFLEYRHYLSLRPVPGLVLAGRAALGSIGGASRGEIPADERFYAGGGGSIRGYEYQSVGEIIDGTPVGGNALFEISVEARVRFGERFGTVFFLDGGMVYEDSYTADNPPLQWGAGVGLRLFTGLGPVRLDVAVPVNPRDDIDEDYQFYISLGQAF